MAAELAALLPALSAWFLSVNQTVSEPYLDEVFHVRQAQHYCQGHFEIWDPKITTPPGLYLLSYLFTPVLGCSITSLRLINAICLVALFFVIRASYAVRRQASHHTGSLSGALACHSALNVVLFPPLFFFSGLYYTDVPSTLSVLVFYWYFVKQLPNMRTTVQGTVVQVVLGVISLSFRQTNIFWVAVAPAALILVAELDQGHLVVKQSMYEHAEGFGDSMLSVAKTSWKMNVVYDPPVRDAFFEDYVRTTLSIAVCAVKALTSPKRILAIVQALTPYLILITIFATFILWNGSVVLGDKSNHVATINIPQMLYLWPFITFFSWPILLPHLMLLPLMLLSQRPRLANVEPLILFRRRYFLPRFRVLIGFTLLAGLIIHFNTVVHPFMLADNRHYPFYVFKRLLRPWYVRYLVAPVYVVLGWACLETRGQPPDSTQKQDQIRTVAASEQSSENHTSEGRRPLRLPDGKSTAPASFVIISLATIALSLCSAPLVEPRYCIIPFIIWRMHLPLHTADETSNPKIRSLQDIVGGYDYRVVLETIWFLVINAATGYIFLNWTFAWPQEPGNLQRFMW